MSDLKAILSGKIGAREAKSIARSDNKEELFRLLLDSDKRTSDNAAWALTHLPKAANAWFTEKQDALIDEAMRTSSITKLRLILNLLTRTTFRRDSIRTEFLDFCFSTTPSCTTSSTQPYSCSTPSSCRPPCVASGIEC